MRKGDHGLAIINAYAAAGSLGGSESEIDAANVAARDAEVGLAKIAGNKW